MGILIINIIITIIIVIIIIIMLLHVVLTSARHVAWQNSVATVPRIALGVGVTTVDDPFELQSHWGFPWPWGTPLSLDGLQGKIAI